jgi:cysteine desulfurase
MQGIKDYAIERLSAEIEGIKFNGRSAEKENSLYTVLSALLPYKNPLIGLQLDMKGIAFLREVHVLPEHQNLLW